VGKNSLDGKGGTIDKAEGGGTHPRFSRVGPNWEGRKKNRPIRGKKGGSVWVSIDGKRQQNADRQAASKGVGLKLLGEDTEWFWPRKTRKDTGRFRPMHRAGPKQTK